MERHDLCEVLFGGGEIEAETVDGDARTGEDICWGDEAERIKDYEGRKRFRVVNIDD